MTINVFGGGNTGGPAFPVQRSVRLRSSASAYFSRTNGTSTNTNIWTWSGWVKRGTLGSRGILIGGGTTNVNYICFNDAGTTDYFGLTYANTPASLTNVMTTQVFRDTSAWYHLVVAYDSTSATATITGSSTDRVRLYVNGVQVTAFSATTAPALNATSTINSSSTLLNIGRRNLASPDSYFDGYLTEVNFIDGQALTPSSFGSINSTTGVWQPIKYSGTYGTNGFYLNFNDNSAATAAAIGKDSSGNGNNWTPNNISVTAGVTYDSMLDVPTLTSSINANFCTLNPLAMYGTGASASNGNLKLTVTTAGGNLRPTFGATSGKYYAEFTITNIGGNSGTNFAIQTSNSSVYENPLFQAIYYVNGQTYNYSSSSFVSYGASYTTGDIIGVAWDVDNKQVTFYKNNVSQGTLSGAAITPPNAVAPVSVLASTAGGTSSTIVDINFGQQPFTYTPPSGFKSLNTYNLPAPTIPNGAAQMNIVPSSVTGRSTTGGGTAKSITSLAFQPDLVMSKDRSQVTRWGFIDSVRGVNKTLASNLADAEVTSQTDLLTAFTSNGFNVGTDAAGYGWNYNVGASTQDVYCYWAWKAGGTAVTNTSGSITSSVSANPSAGFSIVTYTGTGANATVGHGLGVAPKMVIVKARNFGSATDWAVYHSSLTSAAYAVFLNTTGAQSNAASWWNSTAPTSSVFSIGTSGGAINGSGTNYVAYCFSEIAGYSKFGSYTGNGSTDGPFVYCGFRPRWIMFKRTDVANDWFIYDTARSTYNAMSVYLLPDSSAAEAGTAGSNDIDVTANGFKIRNSNNYDNASGGTIIYAAFSESPFNYSLAR